MINDIIFRSLNRHAKDFSNTWLFTVPPPKVHTLGFPRSLVHITFDQNYNAGIRENHAYLCSVLIVVIS